MFSRSVFRVQRVFCGLTRSVKHDVQLRSYSCCINQNMEKHKVIPDVILVPPRKLAKVVYQSGAVVNQGNELTPREVRVRPEVYWGGKKGKYYLLCMIDPDAPNREEPKLREWQHWLVGNIPCDEVFRGQTLSAYIGAAPPKDTGLHRYVFLVYKQRKKLNFSENILSNKSDVGRAKFSIRKFALKYDLGAPIAGNFFQAQWDDYVPQLYQQLGK